ncbi:hypothetical protein C8Q80DRAFT_571942 [Daedaleopsis nitida]|nr:hypothetical protein C8Q80DRAFT_571942 [Daedaleopsis nitida]
MAHRCVRKVRLATPARLLDVRHFHTSLTSHDALAIPSTAEYSTASSSSSANRGESRIDVMRRQKAEDIRSLLSISRPSHDLVWASYLELLRFFGTAKVPLDIHQGVLRKCAPPASNVRFTHSQRLANGRRFVEDRLYEGRYQKIIRNIRSSGDTPALQDYHCVLELFAAVGNYDGAMMVLREIGRLGLVKEPKTYALCLQALCHRLTLPVWHLDRSKLAEEITQHCYSIIQEMAANRVPYASYNVDLAFRILKETMNMDGFKAILRQAYGIDLEYPDRSPLEYWGKREASSDVEVQDGAPVQLPTQLPFTRSAFHTALDFLGRTRNVSKLVQTFEVITTPLPSSSNPAFDDEDEDDFGVSNLQVAPYKPPHVKPNTTTFHILLRWLSKARHFVLSRHFILVANEVEIAQNRSLRELAKMFPPSDIPAPIMSMNRSLYLPVISLANSNKRIELLRWTLMRMKRTVGWKRHDIEYFEAIREQWIQSGLHRPERATEDGPTNDPIILPTAEFTSQFSTYFNPSSSSREPRAAPPHLVYNLQAPEVREREEAKKTFNVDLHLAILRRELDELEVLEKRVEDVIARDIQRIKERLGRRVWGGKNVYLRDASRRTAVSREVWRLMVNYRPQNEVEERRRVERTARARERRSSFVEEPTSSVEPELVVVSPEESSSVAELQPPHKS